MHKQKYFNSGWRDRWKVVGHELHHSTGLVVKFQRTPDDDEAWDCESENFDDVLQQLTDELGAEVASERLRRLVREATEIFEDANK